MTAYTGPTPYDKLIEFVESLPSPVDKEHFDSYVAALTRADGYRRAKTEDAPLLEALRAALDLPALVQDGLLMETSHVLAQIHTAIVQAQGRSSP